jgi:hypothetical protein
LSPAKNIAEDIAKNIAKIPVKSTTHTTVTPFDAGMTKLIVGLTFFGVRKDLVRFRCVLETNIGIRGIWVSIGMIFHRETTIRFLDIAIARASVYPEHFVVIAFSHDSPDRVQLRPATPEG